MELIENQLSKIKNYFQEKQVFFQENNNEIQKIVSRDINLRTDTQIRYSVLNKTDTPTIDAEYWQLHRELQAAFDGLFSDTIIYEKLCLDLEELEYYIEELEQDENIPIKLKNIKLRKMDLEKKQKQMALTASKRISETKFQEFKQLYSIYLEKREGIEYSCENPNEHQIEAILLKCIYTIESNFIASRYEKVAYSEIYTFVGMLQSLKEAAKKEGIYEKIKEKLTSLQQNILEENFKFTVEDKGE